MLCPSCHTENDPAAVACVSCRKALPRGAEGTVIGGRYEVQSCLGKGGMGVVYKAYDRVLEETVAIKVLLERDDAGSEAGRRFRSEIRLARKVTHRNVCRIHDYGEDGGLQYISMQFVQGTDLRDRVRRGGGLPAGEAYDVALQIAEGLQAIHDEGIVHRDLKTANVMIDAQGVVRLMDFGIAKDTAGGESLTGTGHIVGTPEYMSPEQIQGHELDARSDVYSLGVILFELFTGRVPFTAGTAVALLMKHLHEEPPLDDAAASAIPPTVRVIIRKALAKDRESRYGSASELAAALRDARSSPAIATGRGLAAATTPTGTQEERREPPPEPHTSAESAAPAPRPAGAAQRRARVWPRAVGALGIALVASAGVWVAYKGAALVFSGEPRPSPTSLSSVTAPQPSPVFSRRGGTAPTPHPSPAGESSSRRTCEEGDGTACAAEGERYETGAGVGQDAHRAAALYRRGCELGAAGACTRLGVLHNAGRGVEKDVATAAELYEKGCSGGDAQGCNNLGTLYEFGLIGIGADPARAADLYRTACGKGDAQACGNLGVVALTHAQAAGAGREEAIRSARQGCTAGLDRACRKLRELGLMP